MTSSETQFCLTSPKLQRDQAPSRPVDHPGSWDQGSSLEEGVVVQSTENQPRKPERVTGTGVQEGSTGQVRVMVW